ncbi:MAG: M17 family metallopeptidase, partial [Halobacteriaceae archaeon]
GARFSFDAAANAFVVSRDADEAFLDMVQVVAVVCDAYLRSALPPPPDSAATAGRLRHRRPHQCRRTLVLQWRAVASERLKRTFASMLAKRAFRVRDVDRLPVLCVRDAPARRGFWEDVFQRCRSGDVARSLASAPSNVLTPAAFCDRVRALFADDARTRRRVVVETLDGRRMEEMGMGCITGVARGSPEPPRMLVLRLCPSDPSDQSKSSDPSQSSGAPVCLVGKGVTFDTGGTNLKSTDGLRNMHADKTGAAVVVAAVHYLAQAHVEAPTRRELVAVVPLAENGVGPGALKPRDVVRALDGKTVEVDNTDAEGRMLFADAFVYAQRRFRPEVLLDFGTLTGWSGRLFCDSAFAYFCASDGLAGAVEACAERAGERCVRMPKWTAYARYTASQVADLKNAGFECAGPGGGAGSGYMAAMFLSNFLAPRLVRRGWV